MFAWYGGRPEGEENVRADHRSQEFVAWHSVLSAEAIVRYGPSTL